MGAYGDRAALDIDINVEAPPSPDELEELITDSNKDYEKKALYLASNIEKLIENVEKYSSRKLNKPRNRETVE